MKPRVYPRSETDDINALFYTPLPIQVLWGVYARQSTPAQLVKHATSTEMQTDDLIAWLVARGVQEQHIHLFDADLGVSGTLPIDKRLGLQDLVTRIKADEIKAVLVYQVSRLFRDLTGIQYNTFAEDCRQHNCILATADGTIFNFQNDMHRKMFRFLSENAAEYLQQQIKLLHNARRRRAGMGFFAGMGCIPTGYIVDYNKLSETYQRFIPYPPHAEVILQLAERYYALEGNFGKLCRELDNWAVVFPEFEEDMDRRNIVHRGGRRKVPGGYHLSRTNLIFLLTNPFNIGWRIIKGDILSRTDHPPIFDSEHEYLFWYAFNRLSAYTLTGEVNSKRVTSKEESTRYHLKESVPDAGLLKDKIRSSNGPVNAHKTKNNRFVYVISIERTKVTRIGNIEVNAPDIDTPFTKRFFYHLNETHDFDTYKQWVQETVRTHQALIASLESQLLQIAREQQAAHSEILDIKTHIIETAKDEEERKRQLADAEPLFVMNRNRITELEGFKRDTQERLHLAQTDRRAATARTFADFQTELHKLIEHWHKRPFCVRQEFVNLFLQDVILDSMSPHWLRLEIVWNHPAWETDILYIYRQRASADRWTDEERELLALTYPTASQEELLQLFPVKTWHGITEEAGHIGVTRAQWKWYDYPHSLSWADIQFMQEKGIALSDRNLKHETSSQPPLQA